MLVKKLKSYTVVLFSDRDGSLTNKNWTFAFKFQNSTPDCEMCYHSPIGYHPKSACTQNPKQVLHVLKPSQAWNIRANDNRIPNMAWGICMKDMCRYRNTCRCSDRLFSDESMACFFLNVMPIEYCQRHQLQIEYKNFNTMYMLSFWKPDCTCMKHWWWLVQGSRTVEHVHVCTILLILEYHQSSK